jgi:hypothetical protein
VQELVVARRREPDDLTGRILDHEAVDLRVGDLVAPPLPNRLGGERVPLLREDGAETFDRTLAPDRQHDVEVAFGHGSQTPPAPRHRRTPS